jgi:regulator of cell morphogenesis and NO signaling
MQLADLAQHILDHHHAYLRLHMPRLERAFQEARVSPELLRPWRDLVFTMVEHMHKEEEILFPAIQAVARGEPEMWIEGPMAMMESEHDEIRRIEDELRTRSRLAGPLERDLVELLDDLAEHARKEDEELFPAARAALRRGVTAMA